LPETLVEPICKAAIVYDMDKTKQKEDMMSL